MEIKILNYVKTKKLKDRTSIEIKKNGRKL